MWIIVVSVAAGTICCRKEIFEREMKQLIEREVILQDMFARLRIANKF